MLTFFLAVLALKVFDLIRGEIKADYTVFAVIAVFLFYVFKDKRSFIRTGAGVAFLAVTRTMGYYCTTGLSMIPLLLYSGKRGKGLKWLFYAFYPGHLLLLYGIKLALSGQ